MKVDPEKYPALSQIITAWGESYKITRFYREGHPSKVIKKGLTLEEAKEHCKDPETSSRTCEDPENVQHTEEFGDWFDGFDKE